MLLRLSISSWCTIIAVGLWLAMQVFSMRHGIRTSVDSDTYLESARQLQHGVLPTGRDVWYVSYIFLLGLVMTLGGGLWGIVMLQILLSGVAAVAVWRLAFRYSGNQAASWLATAAYIGWWEIHEWNAYVYTDSLFTSLCVLALAALSGAPGRRGRLVGALVLLVFTIFVRPAGIALLVAALAWAASSWKSSRPAWRWSATVGAMLLLLVLVNEMISSYGLIASYRQGEVIYPRAWTIDVPLEVQVDGDGMGSMRRVSDFLWQHPGYFFRLCLMKFLFYVGHIKPYFSTLHNVLIVLILYPAYLLAAWSWRTQPASPLQYMLLTFVGVQVIMVTLTSENWDGRFLMPVLPVVFVLAAGGVTTLSKFVDRWRISR